MNPSSLDARRRLRSHAMAGELGISIRKFREIQTLGMPYTQLQGVIWFEPALVHAWLDKFARKGAPGIKRQRKAALETVSADQSSIKQSNKQAVSAK